MKNLILLFICLCACSILQATPIYVSSSVGDDSRTPEEAHHPGTPWKSLARINTYMDHLAPGDSVLLRRGDVFEGSLRITASGNAAAALVFAAYGVGADPVISGLETGADWYAAGSNIWETSFTNAASMIRVVLVNGARQSIGRYPNSGYLSISNASGSSWISDNNLPASPNWTGAEVIIRKNRWVLDRNTITLHSGHVLEYLSGSGYGASAGYGYFIQNDSRTLDRSGEWYYRAATQKLGVYWPGDITTARVEASVRDTLISVQGARWVVFDHLHLRGANRYGLLVQDAGDIQVNHCTIEFSGVNALYANRVNGLTVRDSRIAETNDIACLLQSCTGLILRDNTIVATGTRQGEGGNDSGSYEAVLVSGDNNSIEGNTIDSTGYIPVSFSGSNLVIRHNTIRHFGFVKDDGGGIYTWNHSDHPPINTNRLIEGNVVLDGIGAPEGTDNPTFRPIHGIYIDDNADGVTLFQNTVAGCGGNGIYLHNAHAVSVLHNNVYNNAQQLLAEHDGVAADAPIRNLQIYGNVFFATNASQGVAGYRTMNNDLALFGSIDSNYYCRPLDDHFSISTLYNNGAYHDEKLDLDEWQQRYQQDLHAHTSPVPVMPYRVTSITGTNQYANGNFNSNINGLYAWSAAGNCAASWSSAGLDGGSLKISFSSLTGTDAQASVIVGIGMLQAGKKYLVRFSLRGSDEHKKMDVFLRKSGSPYNDLSERRLCPVKSSRTENEYLFTANSTEGDASLVFSISEQAAPLFLDNLRLNEVNATLTNPDDSIRFLMNVSPLLQTVPLDAAYIDPYNAMHTGSLALSPYNSMVLIKEEAPLVALPSSFIYFKGVARQGRAVLDWSVGAGDDAVRYEIERRVADTFVLIGQVPRRASGLYTFVDSFPPASRNQYRVCQRGANGSRIYSKIVLIDFSPGAIQGKSFLQLSPNPASSRLTVSVPRPLSSASLSIYSYGGLLLRTLPLTTETAVLDVSGLSKGVYLVCLASKEYSACETFARN